MSSPFQSESQDQELIGKFVINFHKMITETKYNLIALNKRFDYIEQCFNNVLLLNTTQPFLDKDSNQNEFEIAPEDIEYINQHFAEEREKEDSNHDKAEESSRKEKHLAINKDNEEKGEREEYEYIPTGVKPEKKVGKYSEFLKFKQEKERLNSLKKKPNTKKEKNHGDKKLLGVKRKKSRDESS